MTQVKNVVLVGHCGPDSRSLMRAVEAALPAANIESANDSAAVGRFANPESLLLVNRQLDGDFGADDGVELIRSLATAADPPRMLLISNYEDAQEQAESAGARPGFGKSDLRDEKATQRLQAAAGG